MKAISILENQQLAAKAGTAGAAEGSNLLAALGGDASSEFAALLEAESTLQQAGAADLEAMLSPELLSAQNLKGDLVALAPEATVDVTSQPALQPASLKLQDLSFGGATPATEPTPKLMDPSVIKQVNDVILPQGAEQVQLAPELEAPVAERLQLKDLLLQQDTGLPTAAVKGGAGRSPAIDFAKSEIDPKLLGFEDFVAQKNTVSHRALPTNAYGMPSKPQSLALEAKPVDLQQSAIPEQVLNSASPETLITAGAVVAPAALANVTTSGEQKVFQLNTLGQSADVNADSILSQVSDYIVQARAAKEPTVNLKVQHDELGLLDITVNRQSHDSVNIAIASKDANVSAFLGQHREQLLSHLGQAGVTVAELRFDSSSSANRDMGQSNQQGSQNSSGQDRQFGSEQNQRRQEQERREELWNFAREREVA